MENEMDLSIARFIREQREREEQEERERLPGNSMIPGSGLLIRWRR